MNAQDDAARRLLADVFGSGPLRRFYASRSAAGDYGVIDREHGTIPARGLSREAAYELAAEWNENS